MGVAILLLVLFDGISENKSENKQIALNVY
jgi:hypothetical protein